MLLNARLPIFFIPSDILTFSSDAASKNASLAITVTFVSPEAAEPELRYNF